MTLKWQISLGFLALFAFLVVPTRQQAQIVDIDDEGILTVAVGESSEESVIDREPKIEKQILVLANHFPDYLNFFCQPRTGLMRDRFCYGAIDAYSLVCADESPPLQLVPFCFGYKYQCSRLTYPTDDWCEKEFDHYERHCTRVGRMECKSCYYDLDCLCEPYSCLLVRVGTRTAEWCQRYELFCNATAREEKRAELMSLIGDAVRVHKQCVELWGLSHAICNPFTRNFQWERCQKFLFDCELISDFPDDQQVSDSILGTSQVLTKDELNKEILQATSQAKNTEVNPNGKVENRVNLAREKEKIISEEPQQRVALQPQPQPRPLAEQGNSEQSIHTDASNVPEFFVGQAKKQGNRIVINRVKVEPGEVIDRIVSTAAPIAEARPTARPTNIEFKPEELLSLATEVAAGKLKPLARRMALNLGDSIDENSPEWISKFSSTN